MTRYQIKFLIILFYVSILVFISWLINGQSLIGIDDANIYFVYMKNFASGNGFVYNIGGERVEGFTSLLWTLIGSLFYRLSFKPLFLLLLTNIIAITSVLYRITNIIESDVCLKILDKKTIFFLLIVGIIPGFIDWTILSLMETGIWCLLITTTVLQIYSYNPGTNRRSHYITLTILYFLLILCRPESFLWVPVFIVCNSIKEFYFSNSIKMVVKVSALNMLLFIVLISCLTYWRIIYFGYPLPNTFYAKVSSNKLDNFISGAKYIYHLFIEKPVILFVLLHSIVFLIRSFRLGEKLNFSILFLLAITIVTLLIPVYSGGDHFGLHRFIMPSIPIIIFLWCHLINPIYFLDKSRLNLIISCVFFSNLFNYQDFLQNRQYPVKWEWAIAKEARLNSEKLNEFFRGSREMPSQGVLVAGGSAYSYQGKTIDLLGLNNTEMAHANRNKSKEVLKNHASFNNKIFFRQKPDLLWYMNPGFIDFNKPIEHYISFDTNSWQSKSLGKIHLTSKFKSIYAYCRIYKDSNSTLEIFAKKDFLISLNPKIYKYRILSYF